MAVKSNGEGKLIFKNDMKDISKEELDKDFNAIKSSVKDLIKTTNDYRYDLIYQGGESHAWITELSSVEQDKSFADFINRILANNYSFIDDKVTYTSNSKTFDVEYNSYYKINNTDIDVDYERFESDYVKNGITNRKSDEIIFEFNGKSLTLNFNEKKRVC